MSDDLVKRLRESGSRSEVEIHEDREEAADRIEELKGQVAGLLRQASDNHDALCRAEAAEAKLAKARETLEAVALMELHPVDILRLVGRTLAELKGETDD
jgi:uncharacterized protein YigA (DUF484 family)